MTDGFSLLINQQGIAAELFLREGHDSAEYTDDDVDIQLEGVLLNLPYLKNNYLSKDTAEILLKLYRKYGDKMPAELEGEFRGFVWDKGVGKVYIFTNQTSTQSVFYSQSAEGIFIDTSLIRLNSRLKKSNSSVPNIVALYNLLCFGNMLENETVLQGVYKIHEGHVLTVDTKTNTLQENAYFLPAEPDSYSGSYKGAIHEADSLFRAAVALEYQKDNEYSARHHAFLSGGLDSRAAVLYAKKIKLTPDHLICFSQKGYPDERISREIAAGLQAEYEFIDLAPGDFLKNIDLLTTISEGRSGFTGGIHVHHAMQQLQHSDIKLFHSGQIGDGILGGFHSQPRQIAPSGFKITVNKDFLPETEGSLRNAMARHSTDELFLLRNIAYQRTVLGAQVVQQKAFQTSPFMHTDFLNFCLSLPAKWKFGQRFYLEWLKEKCPEATQYRWERTLLKPDALWKTKFGDRFVKRGYNLVMARVLNLPQQSMYPYQYYFDKSEKLQAYYNQYFQDNIDRLANYPALSADVNRLYRSSMFFHKSQAVNILSIFKLFGWE